MGRDIGSDKGREQAEWRDLVARLELQTPIDPKDAPWPDRENLRAKAPPGTVSPAGGSGPPGQGEPDGHDQPDGQNNPGDQDHDGAASREDRGGTRPGDNHHAGRGPADRGRVIRPAGFTGHDEPAGRAGEEASQAQGSGAKAEPTSGSGGPRDYALDEPCDDDLDEDNRYIPPPLPPHPGLDSVAKGAWLALFGGPGYLLIATLVGWQISGWAALAALIAFVAGFVVLVIRLGDGPSKRDGPDQGAVV